MKYDITIGAAKHGGYVVWTYGPAGAMRMALFAGSLRDCLEYTATHFINIEHAGVID